MSIEKVLPTIYTNGNGAGHQPQAPAPLDTVAPGRVAVDQIEHLTDLGNGRRMARLHGHNIRWTEAHGWLVWDGKRWQRDSVKEIDRLAKQTTLTFYAEAAALLEKAVSQAKLAEKAAELNDKEARNKALFRQAEFEKMVEAYQKWARQCESRDKMNAMIAMAQSELPIPVRPDALDKDGWLFNVQNGTLNLQTGELHSHNNTDMITKISPAIYDKEAVCPGWLAFLAKIFNNDQELIAFIKRAVGMSLTGIVLDHHLFFAYGGGQNGKSTFFYIFTKLLGDYFLKCPTETLMAKVGGAGIPNDVARLAGARMVLAAEVEEGKRLDEAKVKDLTGGDTLTARFLQKEFFDFDPTHKLWMYGNHKPVIRGTDTGIWRRMLLIPFTVTITEKEKDSKLKTRLVSDELSGILNWALEGCLEWQRDGLQPPAAVMAATKEYREESDILAVFLKDCTTSETVDGNAPVCRSGELYSVYKRWAEKAGTSPVSLARFGGQIKERGIEKFEDMKGIMYRGYKILPEWQASTTESEKRRHYID